MANILDELAVSLSLDPKKFIEGLKLTLDASKKGQEQIVKNVTAIEDSTKKSADAITGLSRGFAELFGVIGGAIGANAISTFIKNIASAEAALGRMASNLGTTPQALDAWGKAAERVGGNAQAAQGSIGALRDRVFRLKEFGTNPGSDFWIGLSHGGVKTDFLRTKDPLEQMLQISKGIQNIAAREGRANAYSFAKNSFGLDEGSFNLIMKGGPDLRANLEKIMQSVTPTDKDIAASERLQEAWVKLYQTLEKLATIIVSDVEPFFSKLLGGLTKITENTTSRTPPGMQVDLNQTAADIAKNGPRYVPKGSQIPDPNQGVFGRNFNPRYITDPNYKGPPAESSSAANPESSGAQPLTGPAPSGRRPVANAIAEEWRAQGMSEAGVAGIMANVQSESGFNPGLRHADQPNWGGEAHYAHGLYQEGGQEWNNYAAWLAKNYPGQDWRDPRLQSRFAAWNLKQNYPGVWNRMNASTKEGAAQAYVSGYLKPAKGFEIARRSQYGRGVPGVEAYTGSATPYSMPSTIGLDWSQYGSSFAQRTSGDAWNKSISNSSQMYLNGPITVNTQAVDANGFARDLRPAIEAQTNTFMANGGAH